MIPLLNNLLPAASTGAAITLLALAMPRHHETVFGRGPGATRGAALKFSGWLLLAVSLLIAMSTGQAAGIGLVVWFAQLSIHGLAIALLITYAPRLAKAWTGLWFLLLALLAALHFV